MSWGYVPKKLKRQRRERSLRKKYKNFSCSTCAKSAKFCTIRGYKTWTQEVVEFCPHWKASEEAKRGNDVQTAQKTTQSKKRRMFKKP